jgi:protein deglycase
MARACVLLAPGFEEIEAVTLIDVLRRAEIDTVVLGVEDRRVEGSHGIVVEADALLTDCAADPWDVVLLPGGMPGAAHLRDDETVQRLLKDQNDRGGRIGAICAAPMALGAAGVLEGKKATSFPGFADKIACGEYSADRVVVDGAVTTSRGPATALEFALEIVRQLQGEAVSADLAARMLVTAPKPH